MNCLIKKNDDEDNRNKKTQVLPVSMGPYAQVVDTGIIIFISGQIPIIPSTLCIPDNIYDQTYQSLQNIRYIVESKNLTVNNIVKMTLFIKDIDDLSIINKSYRKFFSIYTNFHKKKEFDFPARSCLEVSRLPKDVKIEIESIAMRFLK